MSRHVRICSSRSEAYQYESALANTEEEVRYAARRLREYGLLFGWVRDASGAILEYLPAEGAPPVPLTLVEDADCQGGAS